MELFDSVRPQGQLAELDVQLARLLLRLHPDLDQAAALAAACTSHALGEGHTCLPLKRAVACLGLQAQAPAEKLRLDINELRRNLLLSGAAVEAGREAIDARPLVLDKGNRVALLRWYAAESGIAHDLCKRAAPLCAVDTKRARSLLQELFPATEAKQHSPGPNLQRCAAALALSKRLLILCGGPGTGKTYTLARILALFIALAPKTTHISRISHTVRIALAAPTGRAAMRLGESIREAAAGMPTLFSSSLPEPQTLHRLLGFQPQSGAFLRNAANPLHVDLLVVDEASMVDVLLLEALLAALPAKSRLILCGDPGQLPPVEPGSLLHALQTLPEPKYSQALNRQVRELCGEGLPDKQTGAAFAEEADILAECRISLRRAHRFGRKSGMPALAEALQGQTSDAFAKALSQPWPDIRLHRPAEAEALLPGLLHDFFQPLLQAQNVQEAMQAFARVRVLCALREGPWGVSGINSRCKQLVRRLSRIAARQELYQGLPILILTNDYGRRLYNGDTGIIWPDTSGALMAWFEGEEGLVAFVPATLPAWQPAYAMTVHKAQGAEFIRVLLLLPPEDSPILSRELLYTAITRAKEELILFADTDLLHTMAARRFRRHSNLDRLLLSVTDPA